MAKKAKLRRARAVATAPQVPGHTAAFHIGVAAGHVGDDSLVWMNHVLHNNKGKLIALEGRLFVQLTEEAHREFIAEFKGEN